MLTTLRRERRTHRQAHFDLESLDARLVLSAGAGGAAAEAAGVKAAIIEHRREVRADRHEARLERMEARHDAKIARMEAHLKASASANPVMIGGATSASAGTAASASTSGASTVAATSASTPAASTTTGTSGTVVAPGGVTVTMNPTTGSGTTTAGSTSSSGTLPSNVSVALQSLYQEYEGQGGGSSFTPSLPSDKLLQISGTSVEVSLKIGSGTDFNTALSQLQSDGLQVSSSSSAYDLIDGMVPIADLPAAAQIAASVMGAPPPSMR
jgi:hypothetical protein